MTYKVFGNENAEKDDTLIECKVNTSYFCPGQKAILTGRWGTGKTASLLIDHFALSNVLRQINPDIERLWHIDENTLNVKSLMELRQKFLSNKQFYIKSFEEIWRAEIIRRACLLLAYLADYYKPHNGPHWQFMKKLQKTSFILNSIWDQIPNAFRVIMKEEGGAAATDIHEHFSMLFTDKAFKQLQFCLRDISNKTPKPVIAIEPIETPTSAIEQEAGLAQAIITSLLNAYRSYFQPDHRQLLEVRLSIPWHRYVSDEIDFPQKLRQYLDHISWTPQTLRQFVNLRIEWEFQRVKRSHKPKGKVDAWNMLFESQFRNDHCSPPVLEDSFEYVLRHTHYRPRDIQRIAREAVELFSQHSQRPIDDIISGVGGIKVSGEKLKQSVRSTGRGSSDDLITEAGRRYHKIREIVDSMKGIAVPFTADVLNKRLHSVGGIDLKDAIEILWTGGIIGIEVVPATNRAVEEVKLALPHSAYKFYRNIKGQEFHRWYLFEYNWSGDANEILYRFMNTKDVITNLVTHPKTTEYIMPAHVSMECPIGV